uniref:CSON004342 protein n=1 Tax=Culicoides sonorensis TaxID=179676 RepID=A0A336MSE7_CULSO
MAWTDCYLMFLLVVTITNFTSFVSSHPVPKNDLISGDDFLSILLRGNQNEDLYSEIPPPTRISRYRRPYIKENAYNNDKESSIESLFLPLQHQDRENFRLDNDQEGENSKNIVVSQNSKETTSIEDKLYDSSTTVSIFSSSGEVTNDQRTLEEVTTKIPSSQSSSIETTTPLMKIITSVHVSSSVQEEVKVHSKRPKSKQSKSDDSMKSDSSHFHAIIAAPDVEESDILYSSIPRSRMQRKQDSTSPYQTIIHHDDQGTISFSSLNVPPKDQGSQKQRGSWWWYGWNYPHLSKTLSSTTENSVTSDETVTDESTTIKSTTTSSTEMITTTTMSNQDETSTVSIPIHETSTKRVILYDLNKIPYDKLNAPVEDSQTNDVHSVLGKFVPSCKQTHTKTFDEVSNSSMNEENIDDTQNENDEIETTTKSTSDEISNEKYKTETIHNENNNNNNYRSTEEDDDAKFGYVVEGRNYRKYRVEEKTSDGFIVGEYGVLSHNDGSLRGVRYTADSNINPRLIHDALMKFLSL